jgi:hypothetical protein
MANTDQAVKLSVDADPEMERILETMLEADETITARSVARRHPAVKHASSITRISVRSDLLARYQERQRQFREWRHKTPKRSRDQLATLLAQKDSRIAELERQVEILRVSHLAMIRTVGELGGVSKLLKLYEGYREVRAELDRLGVLPHGEVKQFELALRVGADEQWLHYHGRIPSSRRLVRCAGALSGPVEASPRSPHEGTWRRPGRILGQRLSILRTRKPVIEAEST